MDLDYLENALNNLELKMDLISSISEYILNNNFDSEEEVTKMIQKLFFFKKDPKYKTALLILCSQLFVLAHLKKNKLFFKFLSPKIRGFLQDLQSDGLQNLQIGNYIVNIVDRWEQQQIFAQSFLEKLRQISRPIILKINEERAGGGKHQKFTKYKKNFLIDLSDLKQYQHTSKIYDAYTQFNQIKSRLNNFQQAYSRIDFQSTSQDNLKLANQLIRASQDCRQRLQTMICGIHNGYSMLTQECRKDLALIKKQ